VATESAPVIGRNGYGSEVCGLCSGHMESMGKVVRDRLVKECDRCTCDERCTYARGPKCNCKCGGEFHGTGMVVTVKTDAGGVPVVSVPDNAKALAVAAEWKAALAPLVDRRSAIAKMKAAGWIERSLFDEMTELNYLIGKARKAKTHAGRLKILASAVKC
jgi:hypothetical protein